MDKSTTPSTADMVFLCHSNADMESVVALAARLDDCQIGVWLDKWNLIPGELFTSKIERALDECTAIVVFFGPTGRSPYQNQEMEAAISGRGLTGLRIIPVLLPGASPDFIQGFLKTRTRVDFRSSLDDGGAFEDLICGVRGQAPGRRDGKTRSTRTSLNGACPYKGLAAFDVADHDLFFGRTEITARGVEAVEKLVQGTGVRCLFVVGGSGSGKSSLARAGIVYSLSSLHPDWAHIELQPGDKPNEVLAERLLRVTQPSIDGLTLKAHADAYLTDTNMLSRSARGAFAQGRLLLLVDQFEEVFTQCHDRATREAFIDNLLSAASDSKGVTVLLICVRADFYEDCAKTKLVETLATQQILVGPMGREELRAVIREPAIRAGCEVEPDLLACLLRDCEAQPSPLPLLQIALMKLWEKRTPEGRMTSEVYEQVGLEKALDAHAEEVYGQMQNVEKEICLSLFLQLVEPLQDGRYTRRRVALDELLPPTDQKDAASFLRVKNTESTIGLLSGPKARLIAIQTEGKVAKVDIAHEAILRGWKRLAELLDQNSEFLLWKRRLAADMADARLHNRAEDYLAGGALDRAKAWLKERPDNHSREERAYISRSIARQWRNRGVVLAVVAAVALLGASVLQRSKSELGFEKTFSDANRLINSAPKMAVVVAYEFSTHESGRRAQEILQRAVQAASFPLLGSAAPVRTFSVSRDGNVAAAATSAGILLWAAPDQKDLKWDPEHIPEPKHFDFPGEADFIALSDDSRYLAAAGKQGRLLVWSTRNDAPAITPFPAGLPRISAIAFGAKADLLVAAGENGLILWNADTGRQGAKVLTSSEIRAIMMNASGAVAALAMSDGSVRFWKPPAQQLEADELKHDEATVDYVAYLHPPFFLVSGTSMGAAYVWREGTHALAWKLKPARQAVVATAVSADGQRVATRSSDNSLVVWDTSSGTDLLTFAAQPNDILKIALDNSGETLFGAEPAGVRIYDLNWSKLRNRADDIIRHIPAQDLKDCTAYLSQRICNHYSSIAQK